jgi:hypothetical protein
LPISTYFIANIFRAHHFIATFCCTVNSTHSDFNSVVAAIRSTDYITDILPSTWTVKLSLLL